MELIQSVVSPNAPRAVEHKPPSSNKVRVSSDYSSDKVRVLDVIRFIAVAQCNIDQAT